MSSIFSKIIAGEIPSYKVYEDDDHFAFLDINPVQRGHTLVVPKIEVDILFDLKDDDYNKLMMCAKKVSKAIEKSFECNRVGMTVIGLEVPHAHIHLMPINSLHDMDFTRPKIKLDQSEFVAIAKKIESNF